MFEFCSFSAQAIPVGSPHAPVGIQAPFQPQVTPLFGLLALLLLEGVFPLCRLAPQIGVVAIPFPVCGILNKRLRRPALGRDGPASCARRWAFLPHNPGNIGDDEPTARTATATRPEAPSITPLFCRPP